MRQAEVQSGAAAAFIPQHVASSGLRAGWSWPLERRVTGCVGKEAIRRHVFHLRVS